MCVCVVCKYYTTLCKELKNPEILISAGSPGACPLRISRNGYRGTTFIIKSRPCFHLHTSRVKLKGNTVVKQSKLIKE